MKLYICEEENLFFFFRKSKTKRGDNSILHQVLRSQHNFLLININKSRSFVKTTMKHNHRPEAKSVLFGDVIYKRDAYGNIKLLRSAFVLVKLLLAIRRL
mmetsp:Transcript_29437/g.44574  ORF Transcript_29437/g.44574 Transcript_29437/m.44574 type:complete len:100 (+) Transcript_29437:3264-3563(+)